MKKEKKIFYGWYVVLGCFVVMCFTTPLISSTWGTYLKRVSEDFAISRSTFAVTSTIISIVAIFMNFIGGKLYAKYDRKKVQFLALTITVIGYASCGFAQNIYHMYISSALVGIGMTCAGILVVPILITNWFDKKRGLAMSLAFTGLSVGGSILSTLITRLILAFDWRVTYVCIAAMVFVILTPIILFLIKTKPEDMGLKPYGAEESTPAVVPGKDAVLLKKEQSFTLKECVRQPFFWVFLLGAILSGLVCNGVMQQINPYLSDFRGPVFAGSVLSLMMLLAIPTKWIVGIVNDKLGSAAGTVIGCVAWAVSFICLLRVESTAMLYLWALTYAYSGSVASLCVGLITGDICGRKNYSEVYGCVKSIQQIGMALGPVATAYVFDTSGSYSTAWILMAVGSILIAAFWMGSYAWSKVVYNKKMKKQA